MTNKEKYPHISSLQQDQILKLITKTFYNELINYGISKGNVISISSNLLDCVMQSDSGCENKIEYYNKNFKVSEIVDNWSCDNSFTYKQVCIKPVKEDMLLTIEAWLSDTSIRNSLVSGLPTKSNELSSYLSSSPNQFFAIFYADKLVGLIGADSVDSISRNLEMKKFIGDKNTRGKGVGKQATFLFLYFVFTVMKYNKVYIYTLDKNIANINLNSKFGFIVEGILYQEKFINNKMQDVLRMCTLKSTWIDLFLLEQT